METCDVCGNEVERWWWWRCDVHDVTECDRCSIPGGSDERDYGDGSHRFECQDMEGVSPEGRRWIGGRVSTTEVADDG